MAQLGFFKEIVKNLHEKGIAAEVFHDIHKNPVKSDVYKGVDVYDAAKCDSKLLQKYHFKMIAQDGIFFLPGKLGAISTAHTKQDIKKMIQASEDFRF